jgi:hypothetical protein
MPVGKTADPYKHQACDHLCNVCIERQQDSNSKEEAGNHPENHRHQLHEASSSLSALQSLRHVAEDQRHAQ